MRTSLALLLLALLLPAPALAAESVTFSWTPLRSGEKLTETEAMAIDFSIDLFAGENKLGSMSARNAENNSMVAKLGKWTPKKKTATLSYGANSAVETQTTPDGKTQEETEVSPVANSEYAVSLGKDGQPVIKKVGGGALTDEERAEVTEDWEDLIATEPGDFEGALRGRTMTVGEELTSDSAVLAAMLDLDDAALTVKDAKVVLQELREVAGERCAVFAMEVLIAGTDEEVSMTMTANGEAVVGIGSLRPHSIALRGPLTIQAAREEGGVAMRMAGGGEFSFTIGAAYGK